MILPESGFAIAPARVLVLVAPAVRAAAIRFARARISSPAQTGAAEVEAEEPGIAHRDHARIKKTRVGADELEFAASQLFAAIIRKFLDERVLARHDFREIEATLFNTNAPLLRLLGEVQYFGGIKQRLRGHAAAQDAQPAYFRAAFDHDRRKPALPPPRMATS